MPTTTSSALCALGLVVLVTGSFTKKLFLIYRKKNESRSSCTESTHKSCSTPAAGGLTDSKKCCYAVRLCRIFSSLSQRHHFAIRARLPGIQMHWGGSSGEPEPQSLILSLTSDDVQEVEQVGDARQDLLLPLLLLEQKQQFKMMGWNGFILYRHPTTRRCSISSVSSATYFA